MCAVLCVLHVHNMYITHVSATHVLHLYFTCENMYSTSLLHVYELHV